MMSSSLTWTLLLIAPSRELFLCVSFDWWIRPLKNSRTIQHGKRGKDLSRGDCQKYHKLAWYLSNKTGLPANGR